MSTEWAGAIDCDVHPHVPNIRALQAHMDEYWRDTVELRGIEGFDSIAYPANAPLTIRPDWREGKVRADEHVERMAKVLLDRHGFAHAICNCLYAVQMIRDEHMAAAFARAVNDWVKAEWLDQRLLTTVAYPIKGTPYYEQVADRIIPLKSWDDGSDRDFTVAGRHSRRFYSFATRWMVNEVATQQQRQQPRPDYRRLAKTYASAKLGRLGMLLTQHKVEHGLPNP